MPCEKYQDALIDLAASGAEPAGDLRAHLNACSSCRLYVEREQSLFAAIDTGVHTAANAALPSALLQRFEAHLAQQTSSKPMLHPSRMYAYAALATAAALLLLVLPRLRTHEAKQQGIVAVEARQQAVSQPRTVAIAQPASALTSTFARHSEKRTSQPRRSSEPEVLVPPDERIAFERFLSDLNGRQDLAVALVKPMQEQRQPHVVPVALPAPVQMPDIETASLTVQPLSENIDK